MTRGVFQNYLKKQYCYQYLATIAGSFSVLSIGINSAWTSPYLPQILDGTLPDVHMTNDEGSWCAVMPALGGPLGALIAVPLVDRIGRKLLTLAVAPFTFAMFIILALSSNFYLICAARFTIGVIETVLYTSLPMYLGEISHPSIRGILTSGVGFGFLWGTLVINILGMYCSIFVSSLICSLVPFLHFASFYWMPESPYYYIKKNNEEKARTSLITFRGTPDVDEELKTLIDSVKQQEQEEKANIMHLFTVKTNRLGFLIFFILNFTRKFSGSSPLLNYTGIIFREAGGNMNANLSVIIFLCIQIVSSMVSLSIVDRVGRRPLVICSTVICVLALAAAGGYFFFKSGDPKSIEHLGWMPLTVLTVFTIFYYLGLELTPMIYGSELFPTNIKAIALGFIDAVAAFCGVITIKLFQILTDSYGMYLPFWIFAACCSVTLVFIIKYVPETKNKSLEEIQQELMRITSKNNVV